MLDPPTDNSGDDFSISYLVIVLEDNTNLPRKELSKYFWMFEAAADFRHVSDSLDWKRLVWVDL